MKRFITAVGIMGLAMSITSCHKRDNYYVQPAPTGYQYSFNDDFDYDAHNWSFSDNVNSAYVSISNGILKYQYTPTADGSNTVAINTGADVDHNFVIQTRIRSDYEMGIVFGVNNSNYGYSFIIDNSNGQFAVFSEGTNTSAISTLVNWTASSAIQSGWNDVEMEQVGDRWTGYINGTKVFDIPAHYLEGTKIGFIDIAGTTGYADYLTVQW